MENLAHVPSGEWNLRTERQISHRKPKLISWPLNVWQESLPILKPMNLLTRTCLDFLLFALLAQKYSSPRSSMASLKLTALCISPIAIPLLFPSKLNFWSSELASVTSLLTVTHSSLTKAWANSFNIPISCSFQILIKQSDHKKVKWNYSQRTYTGLN